MGLVPTIFSSKSCYLRFICIWGTLHPRHHHPHQLPLPWLWELQHPIFKVVFTGSLTQFLPSILSLGQNHLYEPQTKFHMISDKPNVNPK